MTILLLSSESETVLKRCTFSRTWYTFLGCLGPPAWITGRLSSVVDVEGDGELGGPGILAGEKDVGMLRGILVRRELPNFAYPLCEKGKHWW